MSILSKLFGPKTDFKELKSNGAQIIDVRSKAEYQSGHIRDSINIPLQVIGNNLKRIRKDKPVIVCCASGMRSGSAKSILKSNGYENVHNGGGWMSLERKLS